MNIETCQRLVDYNIWANHKVWDCVQALTDEQFTHPCDYSIGSVHAQVVHTMGIEWLLLQRLQGISPNATPRAAEYPTRAAIRENWDALEAQIRAYVAALDDAKLMEKVSYISISGNKERLNPRWEILSHLLNHSTDHRAQTLAIIHQLGGKTVEQDLIFYTWEHPE